MSLPAPRPVTVTLHEDAEGRYTDIPFDKLPRGLMAIRGHVVAHDPCPDHKYAHWLGPKLLPRTRYERLFQRPARKLFDPSSDCEGGLIGEYHDDYDESVVAYLQLTQTNLFALSSVNVKDLTNTSRAISANSASTAPTIVAGTSGTAPAFSDYKLGTAVAGSSGSEAGTVNAVSSGSTSGTFTVTGTITNSGGTTTYAELGMTVTVATFTFLIAHDTINGGTGFPVSGSGNLSCTYTLTGS